MAYESKEKKNRWERLQATYRLVVMNDETFAEVGSYRLTLLNVYIFLSSIIVVTAALVAALIAFTPVKRYLPGFMGSSGSNERAVLALNKQVNLLEKELKKQEGIANSALAVLRERVETASDVESRPVDAPNLDSLGEVKVAPEEAQIRTAVELDAVGKKAKSGSNNVVRDIPLEQLFLVAPITGEISAEFNKDRKHWGIDIIAPKNTAIKSILDGFVIFSEWTSESGFVIGIQHPNNIITFYKHNSQLLKSVGSSVKAGEAIAIIGNSGENTTGPHLHFELWHKGKPVNPREYITF